MKRPVNPIALIDGVADIIARNGQQFTWQGRRKTTTEMGNPASNAQ